MLPKREDLNRRDWITRVLQALGTTVGGSLIGGRAFADPDWRPSFFSAQQNQLLIDLGECIIPGSQAALCNRVIDLILTLESERNQKLATTALASFDAEAQSRFGKPFAQITPEQKNDLLSVASADAGKLSPEFHVIKEWVADAYWSSKEGLHELGWTGRIAWAEFPGCEHRDTHGAG